MSTDKAWVLTWAANILECIPNVDVHGFSVHASDEYLLGRATAEGNKVRRSAVVLDIEPAGIEAARLLAEALFLTEGTPVYVADAIGLLTRHTWSGRVPAGPEEARTVFVKMTTTERVWIDAEAAA